MEVKIANVTEVPKGSLVRAERTYRLWASDTIVSETHWAIKAQRLGHDGEMIDSLFWLEPAKLDHTPGFQHDFDGPVAVVSRSLKIIVDFHQSEIVASLQGAAPANSADCVLAVSQSPMFIAESFTSLGHVFDGVACTPGGNVRELEEAGDGCAACLVARKWTIEPSSEFSIEHRAESNR